MFSGIGRSSGRPGQLFRFGVGRQTSPELRNGLRCPRVPRGLVCHHQHDRLARDKGCTLRATCSSFFSSVGPRRSGCLVRAVRRSVKPGLVELGIMSLLLLDRGETNTNFMYFVHEASRHRVGGNRRHSLLVARDRHTRTPRLHHRKTNRKTKESGWPGGCNPPASAPAVARRGRRRAVHRASCAR